MTVKSMDIQLDSIQSDHLKYTQTKLQIDKYIKKDQDNNYQMAKPLVTIVFLINMVGALVFTTLWVKNIKLQLDIPTQQHSQYNRLITQFKSIGRNIFVFDSYQSILAHLSILFLAQHIVKSLLEFVAEYTSIKLPLLTKLFYNLVESGLLFTMIIGFIIIPMFIDNHQLQQKISNNGETQMKTQKYSQKLIFLLIQTFFYSRILFLGGYIIGILTGLQSLRAYGVGLALASVVVGFSYTFDLPIWNYF